MSDKSRLKLMVSAVLSSLEENKWTDSLYHLHPRIVEIISKSDIQENFLCLKCRMHRSSHTGLQLRSLPGHFTANYHIANMRKEKLTLLNQQIIEIFSLGAEENDNYQRQGKIEEIDLNKELLNNRRNFDPPAELFHPKYINNADQIQLKFLISQFIIYGRLPFSIAPALLIFLQDIVTKFDKNCVLNCQIDRNEVPDIVHGCISRDLKDDILNELRKSPFSLLVDSGSDYYGNSYLTVCVKLLLSKKTKGPVTKLLTVIPMGEESTGEALYGLLKDMILDDVLIQKNVMAIATDEASNMIGPEKGLATRINNDFEQVLSFHDLSHIYYHIRKNSVKEFPKFLIEMITDMSSYFNFSTQRTKKFKNLQVSKGISPPLEILTYTPVRWLSLKQSLKRLVRLWEPLKAYFLKEEPDSEEKNYFTPEKEVYTRILLVLLKQLTHYNKKFQATNMPWNEVYEEIKESFDLFSKEILLKEFKSKSFEDLLSLPWKEQTIEQYILTHQDLMKKWMELYPEISPLFTGIDAEYLQETFKAAKKFIVKVLCEMKDRLPFTDPILKVARCVFFGSATFENEPWQILARQFRNIISLDKNSDFQGELKRMDCNYEKLKNDFLDSKNPFVERWDTLQRHYPLISDLAKSILVLPHSSAPVERVFSQMQDFLTPKRNRLTTENLEASLLIHQLQEVHQGYHFPISDSMIHNYLNLEDMEKQQQYAQNEPINEAIQLEKEEDNNVGKSEILQSGRTDQNFDFKEEFISFFKNLILSSPLREPLNQNPEPKRKKTIKIDDILETDEESSSSLEEEVKPKKVTKTKAVKASKPEPPTKRRTAGKRQEPTKAKQKGKGQEDEEEEKSEEEHVRKKTKKTDAKNKK